MRSDTGLPLFGGAGAGASTTRDGIPGTVSDNKCSVGVRALTYRRGRGRRTCPLRRYRAFCRNGGSRKRRDGARLEDGGYWEAGNDRTDRPRIHPDCVCSDGRGMGGGGSCGDCGGGGSSSHTLARGRIIRGREWGRARVWAIVWLRRQQLRPLVLLCVSRPLRRPRSVAWSTRQDEE